MEPKDDCSIVVIDGSDQATKAVKDEPEGTVSSNRRKIPRCLYVSSQNPLRCKPRNRARADWAGPGLDRVGSGWAGSGRPSGKPG